MFKNVDNVRGVAMGEDWGSLMGEGIVDKVKADLCTCAVEEVLSHSVVSE